MKEIKFDLKTVSSGFTLTELILVILFIGIFASVGLTRTRDGIVTIRTQVAIDQITADGYRFVMVASTRSYSALDKGLELAGRK